MNQSSSKLYLTFGMLAAFSLALAGCASKGPAHTDPTRGDYDFRFLSEATDHLMHDLKIAENCKAKKIRPELKEFCTRLYADQSREQEQMVAMLKNWYRKGHHGDRYPLWIETQDGEVFEKFFLEGVLKGHENIAKSATECVKQAKHPELATLCREIAKHRAEEAKIMKAWNCEWFKRCS